MMTSPTHKAAFRQWLLRLFLCTTVCHLPCLSFAQDVLTLEQAIRMAQDSARVAFESRYEKESNLLRYDEFMALRKPQLNLRVAPNYYKVISDLSRDYVYVRNYNNLSAAASVTLSQKMLSWGGEAYVGTNVIWTEYLGSNKTYPREFVATPLVVGYRQTLLGYNPYRWEKALADQRLKAALQQHEYDMNAIAEETAKRYFRLVCAQGDLIMSMFSKQVADTLYAIALEKASIAMVTLAELRSLNLDCENVANEVEIARSTEEVARNELASYLMMDRKSLVASDYSMLRLHSYVDHLQAKSVSLTDNEAIFMAMENSPVLQHKTAQVIESRQQEQKARKEKGLNVALDLNVGMQQVNQNLGEAYRDPRSYALASVTFSVPLMDHGAAKKRHSAAKAWVQREESALEEAERTLREDVLSTLQEVRTSYLILERTRDAITKADEVFNMIADNYANGLCDINTYALAEHRRSDAYQHYLRTLEKYWTSYYHLKTLLGI